MGRKKRKVVLPEGDGEVGGVGGEGGGGVTDAPAVVVDPSAGRSADGSNLLAPTTAPELSIISATTAAAENPNLLEKKETTKIVASNYAMKQNSGIVLQEDIYVSDGSEDDDDEIEIVLHGSRLGIMRRGIHQMAAAPQTNRQWSRKTTTEADNKQDGATEIDGSAPAGVSAAAAVVVTDEERRQREEEELSKLDPAQRAARLLQDKQRREDDAKVDARRKENEDNVSRDPLNFSKRTAFDIKFDHIDDKPWMRNIPAGSTPSADAVSDFFNYGLTPEHWLEYAQQQVLIRQELVSACHEQRIPDPSIVPIQPRKKEIAATEPKSDAAEKEKDEEREGDDSKKTGEEEAKETTTETATKAVEEAPVVQGPAKPTEQEIASTKRVRTRVRRKIPVPVLDEGGAWGAPAAPVAATPTTTAASADTSGRSETTAGSRENPAVSGDRRQHESHHYSSNSGSQHHHQKHHYSGRGVRHNDRYQQQQPSENTYAPPPPAPPPAANDHQYNNHHHTASMPPQQQYRNNTHHHSNYQQQQYQPQQQQQYQPQQQQQQYHQQHNNRYGGGGRGSYRGGRGGGRGGDTFYDNRKRQRNDYRR